MCTFLPKAGMVTEPEAAPAAAADGWPAMLPDGLNVPDEPPPLWPAPLWAPQAATAHSPARASPASASRDGASRDGASRNGASRDEALRSSVVRRRPFRMSPPVGLCSGSAQRLPTVAKYVSLAGQTLPR